MELLFLIFEYCKGKTILNMRRVCKNINRKIPKEAAKKLFAAKRSRLEEALLLNRQMLLQNNMKFKEIMEGPGEERDRFIELMLENDDICQELRMIKNHQYNEEELEKVGFVQYRYSPIREIRGNNFWSIDIPHLPIGILLIPRKVSHWCYCHRHETRHTVLLLEAILHPWNYYLKHTLEECMDDPFRKTRYLPVCEVRETLEERLDAMGLTEEPFLAGWIMEGAVRWRHAYEIMWHPETPCLEQLRWTVSPSFGGGL